MPIGKGLSGCPPTETRSIRRPPQKENLSERSTGTTAVFNFEDPQSESKDLRMSVYQPSRAGGSIRKASERNSGEKAEVRVRQEEGEVLT